VPVNIVAESGQTANLTEWTDGDATPSVVSYVDKDGQFHAPNSDATAPGYTFNGEDDTGLYLAGVNQVGIAAAGASQMTVSSTTIDLQANILTNITDPTDDAHVGDRGYNDNRYVEYTQTSTASMAFVIDEDSFVSDLDTKIPTQQSVKAYVQSVLSGGVQYKGGYNPVTDSPNLQGATPTTIDLGDMYTVTVAGTFYSANVEVGDTLIAEVDSAAQESDWTILQTNLDAASIKTLYESNDNTEAFTTTEQTKLAGIDDGAEVNNISDADATDLTDGGDSTLHRHAYDRDRQNHTGTQLHTTISDFDTGVQENTLDSLADPIAEVTFNGQTLSGVADPTGGSAGTHVGDRDYNDARYVEITGDTMTGDLGLNTGAQINFWDETGDKVYWYSNAYGTGVESNTLTHWAATNHRWRIGGTSVTAGTEELLLNATTLDVKGNILTNIADPAAGASGDSHVGDRAYNDSRYIEYSQTSTASMSFVIDEDNFFSDSDTKVPTQQSV
jgi:hypothetical protein